MLTLDNTLLTRAVGRTSSGRGPTFWMDHRGGGPAGVKAVAPPAAKPISLVLPADVDAVTILGEKLATSRLDGDALYTAPGRPVAVISQVVVEYKAAPPPPPKPARRRR